MIQRFRKWLRAWILEGSEGDVDNPSLLIIRNGKVVKVYPQKAVGLQLRCLVPEGGEMLVDHRQAANSGQFERIWKGLCPSTPKWEDGSEFSFKDMG